MIRKKTTLRSKSGGGTAQNGNGNGNPRQLVDDAVYREHRNFIATGGGSPAYSRIYDTGFSGWSNGARQRDHSISIRPAFPTNPVVGVGVVS